jgi:hypothetical protein
MLPQNKLLSIDPSDHRNLNILIASSEVLQLH